MFMVHVLFSHQPLCDNSMTSGACTSLFVLRVHIKTRMMIREYESSVKLRVKYRNSLEYKNTSIWEPSRTNWLLALYTMLGELIVTCCLMCLTC